MRRGIPATIPCVFLALAMSAGPAVARERTLVGWGVDQKNTAAYIADAAAVGFDVLIAGSNDQDVLAEMVNIAAEHKIKIFSCITPINHVKRLWPERYPAHAIPWQVINDNERAAATFIGAGKNQYMIPYQWGGEPKMTYEVLLREIACFNHQEVRELLKPLIDTVVSVPGIEGVAFDGFGYRNFYGCRCERCQALLTAYGQRHPDGSPHRVAAEFFRDSIMDTVNELATYARSRNPGIKTTIHIWPAYAPDPLYGNRLDVDYCGQTTAWYMLWPVEKIAAYSREVTEKANAYHTRSEGVGMIGYYDAPGRFPVKTAARVDMELRTMLDNGVTRVQVCGAKDVIYNREVAAVFKKYFYEGPMPKEKRKPFNALGRWRRNKR